jgi:hypothetical protein
MAATGFTPISLYYSTTASTAPTAGNLVAGELAINTTDGVLYYKDTGGVVQKIASKATGVVAGSTTQVIYNNAGAYAGSANMTFNGTTLTTANDASISGLTVGKGGGAVANNTAVGAAALPANTTGFYNVAVGNVALNVNTTGNNNSAVGLGALAANTTGSSNSAFGSLALQANTTASSNTAVGYQTGYSNTTGTINTFIGQAAGYSNTTSNFSTYVGNSSGYTATGAGNTCLGVNSGYAVTGTYNTFIGLSLQAGNPIGAGQLVTTGSKNTILGGYSGNQGGLDIRTASNYIVLSDGDGNPRQYFNGSIAIFNGTISPVQATTAAAPAYVKGAIYFDTTLNKLRVGGATAWETITSV